MTTAATAGRVEGTLVDAARLTGLLASGLLAGAMVGFWLLDGPLGGSASLYVEYRQATTALLTRALPPLGGLALLAAAAAAVLGRGRGRVLAFGAVACLLAAMAITVVVHFPLNGQILTWSVAAPPTDWQGVRDSWVAAHALRTLLTLAAFALLALSPSPRPR